MYIHELKSVTPKGSEISYKTKGKVSMSQQLQFLGRRKVQAVVTLDVESYGISMESAGVWNMYGQDEVIHAMDTVLTHTLDVRKLWYARFEFLPFLFSLKYPNLQKIP